MRVPHFCWRNAGPCFPLPNRPCLLSCVALLPSTSLNGEPDRGCSGTLNELMAEASTSLCLSLCSLNRDASPWAS
eukprot:1159325-Pelagomonas_calceolata.AAC.6